MSLALERSPGELVLARLPALVLSATLPAGLLPQLIGPGPMLVSAGWIALLLPPMWIWWRVLGHRRAFPGEVLGEVLVLTLGQLGAVLIFLSFAGWGLVGGGWFWWGSSVIAAALCARTAEQRHSRVEASGGRGLWPCALALVVAIALGGWLTAHPREAALTTDAPAHLGAVEDALATDRWIPQDRSWSSVEQGRDPRFGVAHGLYAYLSQRLHVAPLEFFSKSSSVLGPLWLLAHWILFARCGLGWGLISLFAAALFTIAAGEGRGLGLWGACYPGSFALLMATAGASGWLGGIVAARSPRAIYSGTIAGFAAILGSATVHPFAWWATIILAAHACLLWSFTSETRPLAKRQALNTVALLIGGLTLLAPTLWGSSSARAGLHMEVIESVQLGSGLFVIDPLWAARWGGLGSLFAFPLLVLSAFPLRGLRGSAWAVASALAVWTICFNPLVAPLSWSLASYLTTRLARMVYTPVVWLLVLGATGALLADRRRRLARKLLFAPAAIFSVVLLLGELGTTWTVLTLSDPTPMKSPWARLQEIERALGDLNIQSPVADPRTSYGLRALRGGPVALYPVAHSSPADLQLPARLLAFREMLSPWTDWELWKELAASLGGDALVIDLQTRSEPGGRDEYGFVFDASRLDFLRARLESIGVPLLAKGEGWWIFSLERLPQAGWVAEAAPEATVPSAARMRSRTFGQSFELVGLQFPLQTVGAGESTSVRVWYRRTPGSDRDSDRVWEKVHLRWEGHMASAPGWLSFVSKPARKIFIERSGRSRARFSQSWVPFDGIYPASRWPVGVVVSEVRRVRIPETVAPGSYHLQPTIHVDHWHSRKHWREYLMDVDRYSAPAAGEIRIVR